MLFGGAGGSSGDSFSWNPPISSCYPVDPAYRRNFDKSVLSQLKEMIKIHRNHASIAAWSMCNEPFFTDQETFEDMKSLLNQATDSAHVWDPTREVAIGGSQREGIDRLGKNAIAFYNGDGASRTEFQRPGVPSLVSEYGSTTAQRPGRFFPGWGDLERTPGCPDPWNPPVWRSGQIIWCGFDHGTTLGVALATMGMIDYFRLPKRQYYWYKEALKNENPHPMEPEWPQNGVPAKLELSAGKTLIKATDGTDDTQLVIRVLDASGKHINNNVPVELTIQSGPGEFPTGRKIRFMPPSKEETSDITIRDGQAAIAFRSYHGGKTIIRATSEGLIPAAIEISTQGTPLWEEGETAMVADRPYHRYKGGKVTIPDTDKMLLAKFRPTWVSSSLAGTNKANVNDGDVATLWKPLAEDKEKWWKLALEASYCIHKIQIELPQEKLDYQYKVEVSTNDIQWEEIISDRVGKNDSKLRTFQGDWGCNIAFIRITFTSSSAGLAEVRVGGK